jgi:hypothetical protein
MYVQRQIGAQEQTEEQMQMLLSGVEENMGFLSKERDNENEFREYCI